MKKLLILTALIANACTTVRKDDHSYTYIHNFNSSSSSSSSEEKVSKKYRPKRDESYPSDDFPQYENGMSINSSVIEQDEAYVTKTPTPTPNNVTHNHYYQQNGRVASYNPPPAYSGFAPSARRYLIYGETR